MNYTEQVQRLLEDKEAELDRIRKDVTALRKAVKTGMIPFRLLDQAANAVPSTGQLRIGAGKQKNFPVGIYEGMSIKDAIAQCLRHNQPLAIADVARKIFDQDIPEHGSIKSVGNVMAKYPMFVNAGKGLWTLNDKDESV